MVIVTNLLVLRCVYTMKTEKESIKIINLLSCATKKKAKANQLLDCRHPLVPSFKRIAPAVPMNVFSLEASLLLNASFATLYRNL